MKHLNTILNPSLHLQSVLNINFSHTSSCERDPQNTYRIGFLSIVFTLLLFTLLLFPTAVHADDYPADSCSDPRTVVVPGTAEGHLRGNGRRGSRGYHEKDYFSITVPSKGELHVWTTGYSGSRADLDAYLYNNKGCSTGNRLQKDTSTASNIDITHTVETDGATYLLQLDAWRGNSDYTLHVEFTPPSAAETCPGITMPTLDGTSVSAIDRFDDENIGARESFYYHFTPKKNGEFRVELDADYSGRYISLLIYDKVYDGCGTLKIEDHGKGDRTLTYNVEADHMIIVEIHRRYDSPMKYDVDFFYNIGTPPKMGDIPDQSIDQNETFLLNIGNYTEKTEDDDILSYALEGRLPAGLSFDTATGILSGTPTELGDFNLSATATDKDGTSVSDSFLLSVTFTVESADDLCYNDIVSSGMMCMSMGSCSMGMGCTNTIPLENQGDDTLSDISVIYDESGGMGGSFGSSCGVDPSGSCESTSGVNMGPVGMMGKVTKFDLDNDMSSSDDSQSVWAKNMMGGACFGQNKLYATYIKDGVKHRGELKKCGLKLEAVEDEFTTYMNLSYSDNVMSNDFNATPAAVTKYDNPTIEGGTVTINADGSFNYTPPADFVGDDTFTYVIEEEATGESDTATVTIHVSPPPPIEAVDDCHYSTPPGKRLNVSADDGLLKNDSGAGITVTGYDSPTSEGGSVSVNDDGSFSYMPLSGFTGTDTFTYTITDLFGRTKKANVCIKINTEYDGLHPFELINPDYTRNIRGNFVIAGNTVMCLTEKNSGYGGTCHGQTDYELITSNMRVSKYIDIDGNTGDNRGTWNSSSSYVTLPDTYDQKGGKGILWAGLFWQGRVATESTKEIRYGIEDGRGAYDLIEIGMGGTRRVPDIKTIEAEKVKLKVDTGLYTNVTASTLYSYSSSYGTTYAAYADVTEHLQKNNLAKGEHTFTVANLTTGEGREKSPGLFGGWSIVVIYAEDFYGQPRNISVYNGFDVIGNPSKAFTIGGFKLPSTGKVNAGLSLFSGEGEYRYGRRPGSSSEDWIKISPNGSDFSYPSETMTHKDNVFDAVLDGITRADIRGHFNNLKINNNGVDIDKFDVSNLITGYRDVNKDLNELYIRWSSNNDYITPSMMTFATQLYVPKLCYDYTMDINGYVLESENNEIKTTFGGYGEKLRTHLFLRSLEGDIDFTDVNISYSIDDTGQLHYAPDSTEISENDSYSYTDAGPWTYNEGPAGFSMNIGRGKTALRGGTMTAEEARYIKLDSDFKNSTVDTFFNFDVHYHVDYGSGKVPMHKRFDALDLCPTEGGYNATYGQFNVVDGDADNSNPKYNLFTQVAGRAFDLKVFAHDETNPYALSSRDLNLSVEIEMIRADDFLRDFKTTCENEHAMLERNLTRARERSKFAHFDDAKHVTISYDETDLDFAYRSLAMRVWYLAREDGSLVDDHNCTRTNQTACTQLYLDTYVSKHRCDTECLGGGSGCYDCMRDIYGQKVCSRDNFALRPEAFVTELKDSAQSDNLADTSHTIAISKDGNGSRKNLAAGYKYRFDINATSRTSDKALSKYVQQFTTDSLGHLAQMRWSPESIDDSNCNDTDDQNISVDIYDGSSINTFTGRALAVEQVDQIGQYDFMVTDQNWTMVDWDNNETVHHRTAKNRDYFIQRPDCIIDSTATADQAGCITSSVHTTPIGEKYELLKLEYFPYSFNLSGLNTGAGATNDRDFVYINTLNGTLYPNGIDENMSYNIQGTFRASDFNGNAVSNFVNQCFAYDVNMTLQHTYLSGVPEKEPHFTYDLIEFNTTNPAIITRAREHNTFTGSPVAPLEIHHSSEDFEKSMQGAITMDLGFNFNRENNTTLNPRRVNFGDLNLSYLTSPQINVDLIRDYKISGSKQIDDNITFYYGRAKPGKLFYDDVATDTIATPLSILVYCDLGFTECQNRGIMAGLGAQTNEANWWKSWAHDNRAGLDGNVVLRAPSKGSLNKIVAAIDETAGTEAEDKTITTSRDTATPPLLVSVDLEINEDPATPAPSNYTDRWLIYNESNATAAPSPFYRVRFIGGSGWVGHGDTGSVVGGATSDKKNKRLEW